MKHLSRLLIALLILSLIPATGVFAQDEVSELPKSVHLNNIRYEAQTWNNCGPATVTNALTYFGYTDDQKRAASYLKPNSEDKNVSPWQMVDFINTQVPELPVYSKLRVGGDIELMKTLLANGFPVIIEKGYDPEPDRLGWMGHYLLLVGYDDSADVFITYDSYIAADYNYTYDYIQTFWQHFNYTYIVLFTVDQEAELDEILGDDADERQNTINALEIAREQAVEDQTDKYAWFNMGTNFVALEMYEEAAIAYDQAFSLEMPWRTLWYQFGPFEAYYQVGRYDDVLLYAQQNLNDGGGQYVEETYYYGGLAREAKGEYDRAMNNYIEAVRFNPNFTPAVDAEAALQEKINNQ